LYENAFRGKIEREEEEIKLHNARKSRIDFSSNGVAVAAASFSSSSLSLIEKRTLRNFKPAQFRNNITPAPLAHSLTNFPS